MKALFERVDRLRLLALVLALLPSVKGIFIALIWRSKGPGSEREA